VAVIHRVLRDRLRFSYKIGHRVALERCQIEADIYHEIIRRVPQPEMFAFGDEVSVGRLDQQLRRKANIPRGRHGTIVESVRQGASPGFTTVALCDSNGFVVHACLRVPRGNAGSTVNAELYQIYIQEMAMPTLGNFDNQEDRSLLILDNAPIHNAEIIEELLDGQGTRLLMLPRYYPVGNPIEYGFSLYKKFLRDPENQALLRENPAAANVAALNQWQRDHVINTYRHIGIRNTPMTTKEIASVLERWTAQALHMMVMKLRLLLSIAVLIPINDDQDEERERG